MPTEALPIKDMALGWSDCALNRVAVIAALVLLLLALNDIIRLMPMLLRCVMFWKSNITLEHSLSQARTRNNIAAVTILAFSILADRWGLIAPSFKTALPQLWQLPVTLGLVLGYFLVRRLAYQASRFRLPNNDYCKTLRSSVYNHQIILTLLMLVTALPLAAFKVPGDIVKLVLLIEVAIVTLIHYVRTEQILASRCSIIITFLYLCALEILPLGILVFVCTL